MFSGFLSFEKSKGETLTRILYYLGMLGIAWQALSGMWFWIKYLDNDWDSALWGLIKTPIMALVYLLILGVLAEYVLAHFRIDKSLHDQVTGRAAPPKAD